MCEGGQTSSADLFYSCIKVELTYETCCLKLQNPTRSHLTSLKRQQRLESSLISLVRMSLQLQWSQLKDELKILRDNIVPHLVLDLFIELFSEFPPN